MSATVDERVVEMRFNNKQFEANAKESISTLEKLKNALNLKSSTNSLSGFQKIADTINISSLGKSVDEVKAKFSALQFAAYSAFSNIVNKAVTSGIEMVKNSSIDKIMEGYGEYELKLKSIQTIMNASGESLETVNKYLDELNLYADKTIYSFSDMTGAIGKFTSAGIDLDTSVKAIQGVANATAYAGLGADAASSAFYNFSQALSTGYLGYQDYKSVGMTFPIVNKRFQQELVDTALAMGTLVDAGDHYVSTTTSAQGKTSDLNKDLSAFQYSLNSQWVTTDVLVNTLAKYSDETTELGKSATKAATQVTNIRDLMSAVSEAQGSGWAQSWEIILGDLDEARALWTSVNDVISGYVGVQAEARNAMLQEWKDEGGRKDLIQGIANAYYGLLTIVKPIKEAFRDIFPPTTSKQLVELTKNFRKFTGTFKISRDTAEKLKSTFSGLFAAIDIVKQAITSFISVFKPARKEIEGVGSKILETTANLGDWITKIDQTIKKNDTFVKTFTKWKNSIDQVISKIKEIAKAIASNEAVVYILEKVQNAVEKVINSIKDFSNTKYESPDTSFLTEFINVVKKRFEPLKSVYQIIKETIQGALDMVSKAGPLITGIFRTIGDALSALGHNLAELFSSGDFNSVIDVVNGSIFVLIGTKLVKWFKKVDDVGSSIGETLSKIKESILGTFGAFQEQLKAKTLVSIATAIAIFTASIISLALVDSDKLYNSVMIVGIVLAELVGSMALLAKATKGASNKSTTKFVSTMVGLSVFILALCIGLQKVAALDPRAIAVGLTGVIILATVLVEGVKALTKVAEKYKAGKIKGLIPYVVSIYLLMLTVERLSDIPWTKLKKALEALVIIAVTMTSSIAALQIASSVFKDGSVNGLIKFASSIILLSLSLKILSGIEWEDLKKALLAVLSLAAIMAGAISAIQAASGIFKGNTSGLISFALSINMLVVSLIPLTFINVDNLSKALEAIRYLAITMTGAIIAVQAASGIFKGNTSGLISFALSINMLVVSLIPLTFIKFENLLKGLGSISVLAVVLSKTLGSLTEVSGKYPSANMNGIAKSMLALSAALLILTPALKVLGGMKLWDIIKALGAIAGVLAVLGTAAALLGPVTPVIYALSKSLINLGLAVGAAGVGILALSIGLNSLSKTSKNAVTNLIAIFRELIVGVLDTLADSLGSIENLIAEYVKLACDVLVDCAPELVDTLLYVANEMLESLVEYAPDIVDKLLILIIDIIEALAKDIPKLVDAVFDFFGAFLQAIIDALNKIDVDVLVNGIKGIGFISALMVALAGISFIAPEAMIGVLALGGFVTELTLVLGALGAIAQIPGLQWLVNEGGTFLQAIGSAIGGFVGGIISSFGEGLTSRLPQIGQNLSDFMTKVEPFVNGASHIEQSAMDGVKALSEAIMSLTKANILDGLTRFLAGNNSLAAFGEELADFGPSFSRYYEATKNVKGDVVESSASAAKALAEMAKALPNSGVLVSLFSGDNSLSEFGEELADFGGYMSKYADAVSGVTPESVTASANAASILSTMAAELPNQGGVVSWFTGDNKLSVFGKELVDFGGYMADYAEEVSGLKTDVISSSVTAAKSISELATNLPNSGGVVSWFTGDNDLKKFGQKLYQFGNSISMYYDSVKGINASSINAILPEIREIIDLSNDLTNINTSGMTNFSKGLTELANSNIKGFVTSFTSSSAQVTTAVTTFIGYATGAIDKGKPKISKSAKTAAEQMMSSFQGAIKSKKRDVISEIDSMMSEINRKFSSGLYTGESGAVGAMRNLANQIISTLRNTLTYNNFYNIGANVGIGLANGISSRANTAVSAAVNLANSVTNAAKNSLKVHSPSTVFFDIAENVIIGFVNGMIYNLSMISSASQEFADTAVDPIQMAISQISSMMEGGIAEYSPVITPVIDLSNISDGANQISTLFKGLNLSTSVDYAQSVSNGFSRYQQQTPRYDRYDDDQLEHKFNEFAKKYDEEPRIINNNNFYINSTDPRKAAEEVGYILQRQVERGKAAWAR